MKELTEHSYRHYSVGKYEKCHSTIDMDYIGLNILGYNSQNT